MNQFAQGLRDGEFPVTWSNNFANFGLPLPLFAHQVPAYLGAFLILLGTSTETAYIVLVVLSLILTNIFFYLFFRKYANESVSVTATILASFFPYRALNIYTRGALPEIMSTLFLPMLFLGVWNLQKKKYHQASLLLFFSTLGVALTHPMMLFVFSIPLAFYFFSGLNKKTLPTQLLVAGSSVGLALLSASYYLVPLLLEMKYFYQGAIESSIIKEGFLSLEQLYSPKWFYTLTHPGPRANFIKLGMFEFILFVSTAALLVLSKVSKKNTYFDTKSLKPLFIWFTMTSIAVLLLVPITQVFYTLPLVDKIQYPWRFLNVLQFLIPSLFVMLAVSIKKLQNKVFLLTLLAVILWFRVPEFYGKNYIVQSESDYTFNKANLHSLNMNPVWTGNSEEYETKSTQSKIIGGEGNLKVINTKNASREYQTSSSSELRLVDYTFYFPGWNVVVNGTPVEIEYQDHEYRGLITYKVPAGENSIQVIYKPTKVRLLGILMSGVGCILYLSLYLFSKQKKLLRYF